MAEQMLVTQALDERDLLKKKINQKIDKFRCVDYAKNNEEKGIETKMTREEFAKEARASFQQIMDLIARHQRIEAAIAASNAATVIKTSFGEYTVAAAIALRNRMKDKGEKKERIILMDEKTHAGREAGNFEERLSTVMMDQYDSVMRAAGLRNRTLEEQAENMRLSILGKDTRVKDDKPLAVVDAYIRENRTELLDPLDVVEKADQIQMNGATLLKEIDTQIKISNATTLISID